MTVIEVHIHLLESPLLMCPKHFSEKATGMNLSNVITINNSSALQYNWYYVRSVVRSVIAKLPLLKLRNPFHIR